MPRRADGDAGLFGGRAHIGEGEGFQGAGDFLDPVVVGFRMFGRCGQFELIAVAGEGERDVTALDGDGVDLGAGDVGDIAFEPELRVGVDGQPAFRHPGLGFAGPADEDRLRHIALGADAAVADDQFDDRFAGAVEQAQQVGGAGGGGVFDAEAVILRRVRCAGLGQPQFGQPGQQFAQFVLLHREAAAIGEAPFAARLDDAEHGAFALDFDPRDLAEFACQPREHQPARHRLG